MAILKDSGERREFDTGAVRDIHGGKGRCDLLPLLTISDFYKNEQDVAVIFNALQRFVSGANSLWLIIALRHFIEIHKIWNDPETMFLELSIHFEDGAQKYGERNWERGIPIHCYIDSAIRHFLKWKRGDTDEPHDRAFCWNIVCAHWTCTMFPELNDYSETEL